MALPQPAFMDGRRAVRPTLTDLTTLELTTSEPTPPEPDPAHKPLALVACSGGADSLALAACAQAEAARAGVRVGAVVVDHRMQAASAQVAHEAAQKCRQLGLDPVVVVEVDVTGPGGPEAGARTARYQALEDVREATGAAVVLLGHTLDDQAETVLLGLARGSGARSLAGMPAARGSLRRPFLCLTRARTEQICSENNLDWWTDPTNLAPTTGPDLESWPLRSRIRTTVMPALRSVLGRTVAHALTRTADQLRDDDDALDQLAQTVLTRATTAAPAPGTTLEIAELTDQHRAIRRRALHRAALEAGATPGSVTREHILAIDALLTNWHGQGPIPIPGGITARRTCGRLVLAPNHNQEKLSRGPV